jgi:hypothetical protein
MQPLLGNDGMGMPLLCHSNPVNFKVLSVEFLTGGPVGGMIVGAEGWENA